MVGGKPRKLLVHRKGATRAFPPHHPLIPVDYQVWLGLIVHRRAYALLHSQANSLIVLLCCLQWRGSATHTLFGAHVCTLHVLSLIHI